ncbi:MAG TPA: ribonuclease III [Opitutae bacterium]|nr:ribonuclease III [Opitutae bacterium]
MPTHTSSLEQRIDYIFSDPTLLEKALRHSSLNLGLDDNQRLEFLGDSVLGLIIAETLYTKFPDVEEGKLDRMRASIVSGKTLAKKAYSLNHDQFLNVSDAQRKSCSQPSQSMLEDTLEAVIGAVYLDGGLKAAQRSILLLFSDLLGQDIDVASRGTPKSQLQEWSQKHQNGAVPNYTLHATTGPDHARKYEVKVALSGKILGSGSGGSIKAAEIAAADAALKKLSI